MDDLIFIVDEADKPLSPVPRTRAIQKKYWRRASGILIVSAKFDKILCHKRTTTKDERPDVWVSMFGGKCDPGETPDQTVLRELREESGIQLTKDRLNYFTKVKSNKHHQFEYIFWSAWSGNMRSLHYDKEEVAEIKWLITSEVYSNLSEGKMGWYRYSPEELTMIRHLQTFAR